MKITLKRDTTANGVYIYLVDSSGSLNAGLTGLVYNTASLTAYYIKSNASIAITLVDTSVGVWIDGGFKEVDSTNMPGLYYFALPNTITSGGTNRFSSVVIRGAANLAPFVLDITTEENYLGDINTNITNIDTNLDKKGIYYLDTELKKLNQNFWDLRKKSGW